MKTVSFDRLSVRSVALPWIIFFSILFGVTTPLAAEGPPPSIPTGPPAYSTYHLLSVVPDFVDVNHPDGEHYYAGNGAVLNTGAFYSDGKRVRVQFSRVGDKINPEFQTQVSLGLTYLIAADVLLASASESWNISLGLLVVPYKFQFSDQSLNPGGSVGPYLGWCFGERVVKVSAVVSAGAGIVSLKNATAGGNTATTAPSLSVATGVIVTLKQSGEFQLGVVVGWDWAGKAAQYQYEGKPWFAVAIGTTFLK